MSGACHHLSPAPVIIDNRFQAKKEGKTSVGLNAPTTPEEGDDGTSGGGSATGGSENTGGSDVDIYVEMPLSFF